MKILICDDDLMFAQAVHDRLLEFCSGAGISASVIVHSSAENIPPDQLAKFDIAFLDIDMKPTDGFTLAKTSIMFSLIRFSSFSPIIPNLQRKDTKFRHFVSY